MSEDLQDLLPEDEEQQELFEHFRMVVDRGQGLLRIDKDMAEHL